MKKKFTAGIIAAVMIMATVLGSLTGIISAAVIQETGYPFANYKNVPVYDYETTGTDATIDGAIKSYTSITEGEMRIKQTMVGKSAKMSQRAAAPAYLNGMYITVKNTNAEEVQIAFLPRLGTTNLPKGIAGSKYYLISGDKYEEFEYGSDLDNTTIALPANYEGKIVVKFDSFTDSKGNTFTESVIDGFWICLFSAPKDSKKYMIFDDFGYIGAEKEAGEAEESEYPYTGENRWDEYDFLTLPDYAKNGTIGDPEVSDGKFVIPLNGSVAGAGIKLGIATAYTKNYDAAYFRISATSDMSVIPQWTVDNKLCTIKENGEYFIRYTDGALYKKNAGKNGAINLSAANGEYIITVPYENIVIDGTATAISAAPAVSEFAVVLATAGPMGETDTLVLDDIGFVKLATNSFVIPPKMNGNAISEKELNFSLVTETKVLIDTSATKRITKLYDCGTVAGEAIDQRDMKIEEGRGFGLPSSGTPRFEAVLNTSKEYQALMFDIDTTELGKDVNIRLQFTQGSSRYLTQGSSFFLINDFDGLIYKYAQTYTGEITNTITVPANFKGKVIIPFAGLADINTEENISSVSVCFENIDLSCKAKKDFKYLWVNNVVQIKDMDSIGDKAYKINIKIINHEVKGTGLMDSDVSPASGMDPTYWLYTHATSFVNCFTTDGAYSGTGERITAISNISNINCWGVGYGGSWTCVGKNAIVYYIDATGAPTAAFKPLLFPQTMKSYPLKDKAGNVILKRDGTPKTARYSMGRWTVKPDSKVFMVNPNNGKAKLANITGTEIILNQFKGFIVIPFLEMRPDDVPDNVGLDPKEKDVTLYDISLVTGVSMQFMMHGMYPGDYLTFDQSGLAYVECDGYIEKWNPSGISVVDEGGGTITPGPATGVNKTAAVATAAVLGTAALGFGGYDMVSKKRKKTRAEKRGER